MSKQQWRRGCYCCSLNKSRRISKRGLFVFMCQSRGKMHCANVRAAAQACTSEVKDILVLFLACILFRPGRSSSAVRLAHPWPNIHQETEACYRKREFKRSLGSTPPYHLFARRGQYPSVMGAMGPLLTAGKAHTSADRA